VDDRTALLLAWLEEETERQRRPILPPPRAKDPALRGWVQAIACALGGALVLALFACWLATAWDRAMRATAMEQLRREGFRVAAGDPTPSTWKVGGVTVRGNRGGWLLCVRGFALAFGTVIGALFLRAGCVLHNKLVGGKGSPGSVPEPQLGKAMGIAFVTTLVNAVMGFELLSAPVSLLVMAGMCSALLPTTFTRGLLVVLCYLLVGLSVVGALAVGFGGLWLVLAPLR
jgi:hypothetical protein